MQAAAATGDVGAPRNQGSSLTNTLDIVKLVSKDEKVFYVNVDVANQAKLLKTQIQTLPREEGTQLKAVALDLPSSTLETVIKYLHYRIINAGLQVEQRAEFSLEPEEALDVLNAAIYLQC